MTWYDIIVTIRGLTELNELTVDSCSRVLQCNFKQNSTNRYRTNTLQEPFEYAELISGSDKAKLALKFRIESAREEYAMRLSGLGKPVDIDIISPPIADETAPDATTDWDRRYSLCYELGDCQVWFGIEESGSQKQLVSVTIER